MPRLTIPFNHELEMTDYYLFVLPTVKLLSEMAFCVYVFKKKKKRYYSKETAPSAG